jgi:EmrB/QacA subfamily drug resistance transporter
MTTGHNSSRWAALIAGTLASFLTPFMASAINVALPTIGQEFSMNAVLLGWVATAYLLAAAMFLVPFGRLADIHGRKRIFIYGTATFTLASALAVFSTSGTMLVAVRTLQGLGSAMIFGTGVAILTSVFSPSERGRVLGINVAAVYVGLSLGPSLGGWLTGQFGWRSIFFVVIPLGILIIVFVSWKLTGEWAEARGEPFDLVGSLLYALSLLAVMVGFSRLTQPWGAGLLVAGAIGLAGFALWELRTEHPVLKIELFSGNRTFAFSNLAALINYAATAAVSFLMSLYLQYIRGLSPQQAGAILIAQPIVQAAFSPAAGWLSDRIEPRLVASAGMFVTTLGLSLLIILGPTTSWWIIVACLIMLGFGFALFSSPNMSAIMGSVDRRFYGVASGMLGTMRLVGQTLSLGIATLLLSLFIGQVTIAPEHYSSLMAAIKIAFAIFALLCGIGILASLARGSMRHAESSA